MKMVSVSEIVHERSNQHAFNGAMPFRKLLGEERITFHAKFVYTNTDKEVFSESFVTWYNSCFASTTGKCKNRWQLYYPDTHAISHAKLGDVLLVARLKDGELLLVMAPPESAGGKWITERYSKKDTRIETLPPPTPENTLQISLPQSFTQAKKILAGKVYANDNERQTFYCGCDYSKTGEIDPLSCGYIPRKADSKRSKRLEWEHIVPASYIGKGRACWEQGNPECITKKGKPYKGRRCCEKVDSEFRSVVADLNNLVPEIGELNADRSNYPYREISGESRTYGSCDFEVDTKLKTAEPAIQLRGFIGRTWLYMHSAHGVFITNEDEKVYRAWADKYPPEAWEKNRQARIKAATQTENNRETTGIINE